MDFLARFKGKMTTIGKDGELGLVAGTKSSAPYRENSTITVMTNIDHARNSQSNYKPMKKLAPFTQYSPYVGGDILDLLSVNEINDSNHFEVASAGGFPLYKSPHTMQEFQYSNGNRIDDAMSDSYISVSSSNPIPSYKKIKIEKPSKREIVRNKSVKNENNISDHKIISKSAVDESRIDRARNQTKEEEKEYIDQKSKSQFGTKRPPLPKQNVKQLQPEEQIDETRRIGRN